MKIKFLKDIELTVVDGFDEATDNITSETIESFKAGETVEVDILERKVKSYVDLQFEDGSVAFGILRNSFCEI